MKNTLLTLILLLGGTLFLPISQADQWPYDSSDFNQADDGEDENEDGYPPEGESMPGIDEEDDDIYDSEEDEDPDDDSNFDNDDNSTWLDSDDE